MVNFNGSGGSERIRTDATGHFRAVVHPGPTNVVVSGTRVPPPPLWSHQVAFGTWDRRTGYEKRIDLKAGQTGRAVFRVDPARLNTFRWHRYNPVTKTLESFPPDAASGK